jgi:hypothetical protein
MRIVEETMDHKQGNTQVYSPLGSFVVEQHNAEDRKDAMKERYDCNTYGHEKGIAFAWLLMFVVLIGGSIYNRLGKPDISATSQAEAAVITGTVGIASSHSKD